ncbi:hypothetical protein KIN20_024203 [Parelaphostrongylus tenuis]|uniref:Bicarbonate transporter-like transmembrane domain-containing protein n=1 Tax=Parelaphostrongylus tenuis TaxID=148309 RepID=A0AAD5MT30_PARTN|nr:hypothetical protein KIN20_024203 [Parelaphostrongylus tenuis]
MDGQKYWFTHKHDKDQVSKEITMRRTKKPWFISDFTDFFTVRFSQSLAATIFLFFANITSIITFGAVMERTLHHQMASMEAILSGGISGVLFAAFSGQPLNILSATGPTLEVYESPCFCYLNATDGDLNRTDSVRLKDISAEECEIRGGEAVGLQCHFKPDVYMLSVLLTFGTFALAYALNIFRHSRFFGSTFRQTLSDFGVVVAIVVMTAFSLFVGLDVPSLHVPQSFKPTLDRPWFIDISRIPLHVALISSLPAAFYTILIVMDQQITAVIINRRDNLLRKGHGYHLDLLVIGLLVLVCSFLGLPFYVAATVLSVMHVNCLRLYSESSAPGEIPRFLGVKEQRLTGIFAHILIGLSVFLTRVIKVDEKPII